MTRRAATARILTAGTALPLGVRQLLAEESGEASGNSNPFPVEDVTELIVREELPGVERAPEDRLELDVAIQILDENQVEEIKAAHEDEWPRFKHAGKLLPDGFYPGSSMITRFALNWGGRDVPVEPRFWDDLSGMWLRRLVLPQNPPQDPAKRWEHEIEIYFQRQELRSPSLSLSDHGGTALISWPRPEE